MKEEQLELSDEQLMLLEQLTYLDGSVVKAAGLEFVNEYNSVGKMLNEYDDNALKKLENAGTIGNSYTQGSEWAAVIRAIKADSKLMNLKISDIHMSTKGKTVAICFESPENSQKAIVAFRGTIDGEEWEDNVKGFNVTDTQCQKEALNYVESLKYSDITVVGHSKGGNKAQYVAITSDKVTRCLSMDGQGFSQEFIDKYWAEIRDKGEIITNYSLNNDYVHILLFPVSGIKSGVL